MAFITTTFKLDLTPGASRQVIHASQGDIGRPFKAELYWNGTHFDADDYDAILRGKKVDATVFEYDTPVIDGYYVTFSTAEQMTVIGGPVECELVFSNDGDIIASANFVLMVEDSPYNPDALSESDIPTIGDLIEQTIGGDIRDEVDALIEENPELMLQDNAVTTPKIADGAVTSEKVSFVDFIFPKNWITNNVRSGDVSIIKANGKNIMIDTQAATVWNDVKTMLQDADVSHVDYLILSHYHTDHVDNVGNLITNGFVDKDTIVFVPATDLTILNGNLLKSSVINSLNNADIPYHVPEEGEVLTIGSDFSITFFNCDEDTLEDSGWTDYNDYSTICLIKHGNVSALYTGDAQRLPLVRALNNNYIENAVDLYKIEHHGMEIDPPIIDEFLKKIVPKYALLPSSSYDAQLNAYTAGTTIQFLSEMKCKLFAVHESDDYIVFKSDGCQIKNTSGKASESFGNYEITRILYVDINTTNEIQDGTQAHPFKQLKQAIASVSASKRYKYTIYVANGTYSDLTITSKRHNSFGFNSVNVEIIGQSHNADNVIISNSANAIRNANVTFRYLTFDKSTDNNPLTLENSTAHFENCKFINGDTQLAALLFSNVSIGSVVFENFTTAIYASSNATVAVATSTFTNSTPKGTAYLFGDKSTLIEYKGNSFVNVSTPYNFTGYAHRDFVQEQYVTYDSTSSTVLEQLHGTATDEMTYQSYVYFSVPHPKLGGANGFITGFRSSSLYGSQVFVSPSTFARRTLYNGTWTDWVFFSADTVRGRTEIPVTVNSTYIGENNLHAYYSGGIVFINGYWRFTGAVPDGAELFTFNNISFLGRPYEWLIGYDKQIHGKTEVYTNYPSVIRASGAIDYYSGYLYINAAFAADYTG